MTNHPIQRICIRTPNWLGDLMMSTAFISRVLEQYPEAQVDLIVKQGFEKLPLPQRGEILPFDKNQQSATAFGKGLRAKAYDIFFVLPPSFSAAQMAWASRAKQRIGHAEALRSLLLKPAVPYAAKPRTRHIIKEYLELLGPNQAMAYPRLEISEAWLEAALPPALAAVEPGFVALCPGAIYGPAKQWPVAAYAELANLLAEQGQRVVILGQPEDFPLTTTQPRIQNLCGSTNLVQFLALLAKAKSLVSNDSGSMHVMAALGKPQVAIFGSTSLTWTGPQNPQARVLHRHLPCSPCFSRECPLGHYDCLRGISPQQVLHELASL